MGPCGPVRSVLRSVWLGDVCRGYVVAFAVPAASGWAGPHTDTNLPLKHEKGGPNHHNARKRPDAQNVF
jgi:hypothetical protein